jgi:hypothetical protein
MPLDRYIKRPAAVIGSVLLLALCWTNRFDTLADRPV